MRRSSRKKGLSMGRKRKTRAERWSEAFAPIYRVGKARVGLREQDVAQVIGFKERAALLRRRKNPGLLTLDEFILMGTAFQWSEDEMLEVLRAGKI